MTRGQTLSLGHITGPFAGSLALAEGWLTEKQLRSPLFVRLFHNVYVPAAIPVTHELRCRAVAAIAPPEAVVTGLSAAAVYGLQLAGGHDPVEVLLPEGINFRAQRGINIRRTRRETVTAEPWHQVRLAGRARLALDMLTNTRLHRSLPRVVAYCDSLVRAGFVEGKELEAWLRKRHDNGIVRARQAVDLLDARAESVPESEVRVWLAMNGLRPEPQVEVRTEAGEFLGRLDLAFRELRVAVEYDGKWHFSDDQRRHDFERRARMTAIGWEFVLVTRDQLYGDPQGMVTRVREALRLRGGTFI